MVAGQNINLGPRHRGKIVAVIIEDTHLRVLHGEEVLDRGYPAQTGPIGGRHRRLGGCPHTCP
jgi:hypothetical protein